MNVFELTAKIALDTSEYENALDGAKGKTNNFASTVASVASGSVLSSLFIGASKKAIAFGKDAVETGASFDAAMSRVKAISGATEEDFESLREKALEMGAGTKFTAEESAEALYYMSMAGWKTDQMLSGLPGVLNLAAASGESLGTTADIVTDALTAFGLTADDTDRFVDVLAATAANANTDVYRMGETFKYVASTAGGAAKYSIEDVAVAIGLMANAGIKGSMAGTSLRSTIVNLANPSDNAAMVMEKYGISITDASGKMLPFMDVLTQLRAAFSGSGEDTEVFKDEIAALDEQFESGLINEDEYAEKSQEIAARLFGDATKIADAAEIAGKYGMAGFLAMVTASDEDVEKLSLAISNSNGAAEEMAETMQDNLLGSLTKLSSVIDGIKISISDGLAPSLKTVVESFTEIAKKIDWEAVGRVVGGAFEVILAAVNLVLDAIRQIIDFANNPLEVTTKILSGAGAGDIDQLYIDELYRTFRDNGTDIEYASSGFVGIVTEDQFNSVRKEFMGGSNANGSSYIPEDGWNYLHHGERVLTAEENREYTGGSKRGIAPIYITVQSVLDGRIIGETAYEYAEEKARATGA